MPLPAETLPAAQAPSGPSLPLPSLCIMGDSHIASLKKAMDEGMLPFTAHVLEFWGAYGPHFRALNAHKGTVSPVGAEAAEIVARINGCGREVLRAQDFEAFLFYGARLRMASFMPGQLVRLCAGMRYSQAVRRKATRRFLLGCRTYRIAAEFARLNPRAHVTFAPAPLMTKGVGNPGELFPGADNAGPAERDIVRQWLDEAAAEDRVILLHQPEDTIVDGYWTDPAYASEPLAEATDPVHKSLAFAALMFDRYRAMFG